MISGMIILEIIWTGGLPHPGGLPHLPGFHQLHENRPYRQQQHQMLYLHDHAGITVLQKLLV